MNDSGECGCSRGRQRLPLYPSVHHHNSANMRTIQVQTRQRIVVCYTCYVMRFPMPEECFPLSSSQRRFWILDQLHPGSAAYHLPVCLRLAGPLVFDALERSLEAIAARHGSLRTTFSVRDGVPFQFVKSRCDVPLQLLDISAQEGPDLEARAYSSAHAEILRPFDLKNGPLLRAALLRLSPEHHILVSTMHHIVSDGWSAELFVRELAEHYAAFSVGQVPSLNPLPNSVFRFHIGATACDCP